MVSREFNAGSWCLQCAVVAPALPKLLMHLEPADRESRQGVSETQRNQQAAVASHRGTLSAAVGNV